MASSIIILVHFFAVFIFAEAALSAKNAKFAPSEIYRYMVYWNENLTDPWYSTELISSNWYTDSHMH